ncbi:hypothetical protein UFOVP99_28 [uncultured Caudovirales phage]|uniref:Uncharacterized protein n=1 Tax=uncultured Caudovirales phage TaxID=2100421 RepID=A0A6J5L6U3_9CAUD|nr:hypothetical protein UFOVP99_28 [uncultured Caudovirales phage]
MSFAIATFQPIGGTEKAGTAPQLFGYRTTDLVATVEGAGYFNAAVPWGPRLGDFIMVDGSGAATPHAGIYNITALSVTAGTMTATKLVRIP